MIVTLRAPFSCLTYTLSFIETLSFRWWYARDVRTGEEGVVPAAYLY